MRLAGSLLTEYVSVEAVLNKMPDGPNTKIQARLRDKGPEWRLLATTIGQEAADELFVTSKVNLSLLNKQH